MSTTHPNQEDEFYRELDEKTEKKSCCTFYTLGIFFAVLVVLIIAAGIIGFRMIRSNPLNIDSSVIDLARKTFENKIDTTANAPTITVTISTDDLNGMLKEGVTTFGLNLEEPQAQISEMAITINGFVKLLWRTKIELTCLPEAKEGKVTLKVLKVKAGVISFPRMLQAGLEKSLNQILDANLAKMYQNYQADLVELSSDQMIIKGKLKN